MYNLFERRTIMNSIHDNQKVIDEEKKKEAEKQVEAQKALEENAPSE